MLDFRPTRRRPDYTVKVCIKPVGMRVHNKLDGSYSVVENTNQVVIKGTHDEEWVLDNASLVNFYQTLEGGLIDLAKLNSNWLTIRPRADGRALFASRIPVDDQRELLIKGTKVTANLPDIPHDNGDYLVCYAKSDNTPDSDNAWLVNGVVFKATFDMRGFEDIN